MIVDNGKYYLYRHIRVDTNEVFYVGMAKKNIYPNCRVPLYTRAESAQNRNMYWENIVKQTEYISEILLESDDKVFMEEKEKEFIKLYGRSDTGSGNLCNLTDGGVKGLNKSQDAIKRQLETAKRNGTYYDSVERMKLYAPKKGSNGINNKKTYLYNINGNFIKDFNTRNDCAEYVDTFAEHVTKMIRVKESHKGFLFLNEFMGENINVNEYKIKRAVKTRLQLINIENDKIIQFESITALGDYFGVTKQTVLVKINKGVYKTKYLIKTA